jgi:hypothetical protein
MKSFDRSTLITSVAFLVVLAAVPLAQAGVSTASISIHIGAEQPTPVGSFLAPTDVTGVVPSANWNNEITNTGVDPYLVQDVDGVATNSGAHVFWYATSTWSSTGIGEENNNFAGADRKLMSGYLDMQNTNPEVTFIQISNLPGSLSGSYTVYVYALSGQPGRGGFYSVNEAANRAFQELSSTWLRAARTTPARRATKDTTMAPILCRLSATTRCSAITTLVTILCFQDSRVPRSRLPRSISRCHSYPGTTTRTLERRLNGVQIVAD